jgi:transposase
MAGKTLQLGCRQVAAVVDGAYRAEKAGWYKQRLLAIKLAARGEHTGAEIADLCGLSRASVFSLVKAVREGGLQAISKRNSGGRPEGWRKGVSAKVMKEFETKLAAHEFVTLQDAVRWLEQKHGIKTSYNRVWYWAKKLGGVVRVPRPSHSKKNPAAAEVFRRDLGSKLEALGLPQGSRAKVWVMDEARFGLHTLLRKLWTLRGVRPIVSCQTRYEWDYLYGALEVTQGEAHFCQIGTVNLDCDRLYLQNLASSDPQAVHVVIRDQAGFHLRDGDWRLPANVRIIDLPPYSPELNPCEQLWDLIKDQIGNRIFDTIEELRQAIDPILERWWSDAHAVLSLIGRPWLHLQANTSSKKSCVQM